LNWGDVTIQIHSSSPHPEEDFGDEVPDEDADNYFLPTDNSDEDFDDKVADEDADDDFLPTDNSVCIFASEGEHVLSLSSLLAPNYHPQLERLSKFHLHFCLLVLPLTMLIFHVIFF
jgi:hypothetical protein